MFHSFNRVICLFTCCLGMVGCHRASFQDDKSTAEAKNSFQNQLQSDRHMRSQLRQCALYFKNSDPKRAAIQNGSLGRSGLYGGFAVDPAPRLIPYGVDLSCVSEPQNDGVLDNKYADLIELIENDYPQPLVEAKGYVISISKLNEDIIDDHLPDTRTLKSQCLTESVNYHSRYNLELVRNFPNLFRPSCSARSAATAGMAD